mmetsp:Transcript_70617/g.132145  ORF Transcript_70617/g.132145 Transcript_70617/m.132145 type:complete len:356 (+) Transcript_70617:105-1172(+)
MNTHSCGCGFIRRLAYQTRSSFVERRSRWGECGFWLVIAWLALIIVDGLVMAALISWMIIDDMRGERVERGVEVSEEVTSQVMCMLFFLQALVMQPSRLAALWLLISNYGSFLSKRRYPPIKWWPMFMVFLLLNLNCWFRFLNVYFMWKYMQDPTERPLHWELSTLLASIGCGIAGTAMEGCLVKRATNRVKVPGSNTREDPQAATPDESNKPKLTRMSSSVSSLDMPLMRQFVVAMMGGLGLGMEGTWNSGKEWMKRLKRSGSALGGRFGRSGSSLGATNSEMTNASEDATAGTGSREQVVGAEPVGAAMTLTPVVPQLEHVHGSIIGRLVQPEALPAHRTTSAAEQLGGSGEP